MGSKAAETRVAFDVTSAVGDGALVEAVAFVEALGSDATAADRLPDARFESADHRGNCVVPVVDQPMGMPRLDTDRQQRVPELVGRSPQRGQVGDQQPTVLSTGLPLGHDVHPPPAGALEHLRPAAPARRRRGARSASICSRPSGIFTRVWPCARSRKCQPCPTQKSTTAGQHSPRSTISVGRAPAGNASCVRSNMKGAIGTRRQKCREVSHCAGG